MYLRLFVFIACAISCVTISGQENEPPEVRIITPIANEKFSWGTLIPFEIGVKDKEDGYTEYEEISPNKVILTVQYLSDGEKASKDLNADFNRTIETLSFMGTLDCFTCHKAKEKLIGPSFAEIAERYGNHTESVEPIAQKILRGAQGTWGDQIMPAHLNITQEEANQMVSWILKNGSDADFNFFTGTSGAFRTRNAANGKDTASYALTAFYTDEGVNGNTDSSKTGSHTILLRQK
ncbi:c-type cytochrome [Maribacter halichondriae]|uniref:c-type cytochrome n=1 Tax=Maribacter halichondriae TaxID=2980554 RepID=UPI002358F63E|nr:c-type cytochrome [Maribacter sp. Hal144]